MLRGARELRSADDLRPDVSRASSNRLTNVAPALTVRCAPWQADNVSLVSRILLMNRNIPGPVRSDASLPRPPKNLSLSQSSRREFPKGISKALSLPLFRFHKSADKQPASKSEFLSLGSFPRSSVGALLPFRRQYSSNASAEKLLLPGRSGKRDRTRGLSLRAASSS